MDTNMQKKDFDKTASNLFHYQLKLIKKWFPKF